MSEGAEGIEPVTSEEPEVTPGYKVPEKAGAADLLAKDKDDAALENYKKELMKGANINAGAAVKVIVYKMTLSSLDDDHKLSLDLTGELEKLKESPMLLKEGIRYKIEFNFKVENDIVTGLKYHHVVKKGPVSIHKETHMLGSYAPKPENTFLTPEAEMPSGMLARGNYSVKSKFLDDDKNVYAEWDWAFKLSKDWSA